MLIQIFHYQSTSAHLIKKINKKRQGTSTTTSIENEDVDAGYLSRMERFECGPSATADANDARFLRATTGSELVPGIMYCSMNYVEWSGHPNGRVTDRLEPALFLRGEEG